MDIVRRPEEDTAAPEVLKGEAWQQMTPARGSSDPWNLRTGVHRDSLFLGQRGEVTGFLPRSHLELTQFPPQMERLYHEPFTAQAVTLDNPNPSHLRPAGLDT